MAFDAADGTRLEGRAFGEPEAAVGIVLVHGYLADQRAWWPEAAELATRDARVLAFNLRGYCPGGTAGCSGGAKEPASAPDDVVGAAVYLSEQGAQSVVLIGADTGATAALIAGAQLATPPLGVVALSAPVRFEGMDAEPAVEVLAVPKLFIAGTDDFTAAGDAELLYDAAANPKQVQIVTTADHGTELLGGAQASRVRQFIDGFLSQVRAGG